MWYKESGKEKDIVISTRVRLARNLRGYSFDERLDPTHAGEIISKVKNILKDNPEWEFLDLSSLSEALRKSMAEEYIISPELAVKKGPCALLKNKDKSAYIMLLEEDHMRIQCILSGFDLARAADTVLNIEGLFDSTLDIAYDEKFGYLTHCPTNLGTGMRASVMLHLPLLTISGEIRGVSAQLSKMGLTVRGMNGEGTEADGYIYQISNQVTLCISEEETVDKLSDVITRIVERERTLRENIDVSSRDDITDRVMRNIGILTYATRITARELVSMYSDLRLGVSLGVLSIPYELLDRMLIECMQNMLCKERRELMPPAERDATRARKIRDLMSLSGFKRESY